MNSEEAIQYFDDEIRLCKAAPSINGCQMTEDWQRTIDACEIAVSAIRKVSTLDMARGERDVVTKRMIELEQEIVTNRNEPLTLDELRQMDGEPVWLVNQNGGRWVIMSGAYLWDSRKNADYGKTWLAYRQKPEEGTV